jgi:uncharacterized membrane protein YozB (DUF420 family)
MDVLLIARINLLLQICVLVVLSGGFILKRMGKLLLHGITMTISTVLGFISFVLVMLPSLFALEILRTHPTNELSLVTLTHAGLGATTLVLAAGLTISWGLRHDTQHCFGKKKIMCFTFVVWVLTLLSGILTYWLLYGS